MKHDDLDKRVSAYVDGALRGPKRERLERELDADAGLADQVARSRALGRLVREAWTEGPSAPAADFLIAAIRPALAEIDRERNAQPAWQRSLESLLAQLTSALRPSPALAFAAAGAFVLALTLLPRFEMTQGMLDGNLFASWNGAESPTAPAPVAGTEPNQSSPLFESMPAEFSADGPGSVYDLSPGRRPAVLFHSQDGSTMLWVIDEGDTSMRFGAAGGWG